MRPLAFQQGYAIVFWAAVVIWAVPEWLGSVRQRAGGDAAVQDRGSQMVLLTAMAIGLVLAFWLPFLVPQAAITWHRRPLFFVGTALMLLGVALRWYAIRVLGRYFTRNVAVHPGQEVVQAGPYRFIRHPAYSGSLLTYLGIGLALTNWASILALMFCTLLGYGYRVRVEEQVLCQALGQPYREYMRHTRRFIPFVL